MEVENVALVVSDNDDDNDDDCNNDDDNDYWYSYMSTEEAKASLLSLMQVQL